MLKCPKCNRIIVDTTQEGGVKVRSRMILFDGEGAHAICPSCKTKVDVPLSVDFGRLPSNNKPNHFVKT